MTNIQTENMWSKVVQLLLTVSRAIFLQITFFLLVPELFYFLPTTNYDVDFEKENVLSVVEHNKLPFTSSNSKKV